MAKKKDRFAFMKVKPTAILLEVRYVVNGGDIRSDEMTAVRRAVGAGASKAAFDSGMSWSMTEELRSMSPEVFQKMLVRKRLM